MMPSSMSQMPQDPGSMDQSMGQDQGKSSKLLALQNILGGIAEISDDEMRPYIEQAMQQIHMAHESNEGDQMGADDASQSMSDDDSQDSDSDMSPDSSGSKPGMDITVGVGAPKMGSSDDMDEDQGKPKGFLAILAKKVADKRK